MGEIREEEELLPEHLLERPEFVLHSLEAPREGLALRLQGLKPFPLGSLPHPGAYLFGDGLYPVAALLRPVKQGPPFRVKLEHPLEARPLLFAPPAKSPRNSLRVFSQTFEVEHFLLPGILKIGRFIIILPRVCFVKAFPPPENVPISTASRSLSHGFPWRGKAFSREPSLSRKRAWRRP